MPKVSLFGTKFAFIKFIVRT